MDVVQTTVAGPMRHRPAGGVALAVAVLLSAAGIVAMNVVPSSAVTCGTSSDNVVTTVNAAEQTVAAPAAAQTKIKIWMAGDSTMANATTCPIGWGSRFAPSFNGNVTVVNRAVPGRSIQTWLYDPNVTVNMNSAGECVISPKKYSDRWTAMLDAKTGMKPGDYLFIQFGINDSSRTCNRHVGGARYRELLGLMAKAALARGAHPIFLTPVAAILCSGNNVVPNRGFLTETKNAGTADKVPVIDLNKLSLALYTKLKLCPNNGDYTKGAVGAFFCNDHTHFEAAGAGQIAAVVTKAIRDQHLPLVAYLK